MKLKKEDFLRRLQLAGVSNRSDFAKKCGFSKQALASWISGERNPKPNHVKIMAEILCCRMEDIAEPDNSLENVAVKGDKFAQCIIGMRDPLESGKSFLEGKTISYISKTISEQVKHTNQTDLARKIGISPSQVNRITHEKADLSLFPIGAVLRLCPEIFDQNVLNGSIRPSDELENAILNIRLLSERISDISVAKTVENMLKGLVG